MQLVILDYNGCLCIKKPKGKPALLRHNVHEFIEQLFELQDDGKIRIAFWTCITKKNASIITNQLLTQEQQDKCLFLWNSDHCTPHPDLPFKQYKDLENVWKIYPNFNNSNTFLLDDSKYKAMNQPENLILVFPFTPTSTEQSSIKEYERLLLLIKRNLEESISMFSKDDQVFSY